MKDAWTVLVGDDRRDPLIPALARELAARGAAIRSARPAELGGLRVHADETRLWLDGIPVRQLVFRTRPASDFAQGFAAADTDFVSAEMRAVWLHLLTLPETIAVNRGDPDTWFVPSEWAVWRRRLVRAGVPVTPLAVGAPHDGARHWLQWSGGMSTVPDDAAVRGLGAATAAAATVRRVLWCAGVVGAQEEGAAVEAAGRVLAAHGVVLAGLDVDEQGRIIGVTTLPAVGSDAASTISERLAGVMDGALDRR